MTKLLKNPKVLVGIAIFILLALFFFRSTYVVKQVGSFFTGLGFGIIAGVILSWIFRRWRNNRKNDDSPPSGH